MGIVIPRINDSVGEEIHSDSTVTTRFIQFVCVSSSACKLRKLEKSIMFRVTRNRNEHRSFSANCTPGKLQCAVSSSTVVRIDRVVQWRVLTVTSCISNRANDVIRHVRTACTNGRWHATMEWLNTWTHLQQHYRRSYHWFSTITPEKLHCYNGKETTPKTLYTIRLLSFIVTFYWSWSRNYLLGWAYM